MQAMFNSTTVTRAFAESAGISAERLQQCLGALLLTLTLVWAAWIILSTVREADQPGFTFITLVSRVLGVLVVVSSCIVLVHIH
jgi:hypothetical protein